ncbi:MAG TPA: hypothetical protein ENK07_10660 [Bacteroidetes bacterium]|nr:hypothetical protein [Bacteroidota bacterium]
MEVTLDYKKIAVAVDGSRWSSWAEDWALEAARVSGAELYGVHVYAAQLHRVRFEQMEPGLPGPYQEEEKLGELRGTHDSLITDGLKLISDAYLREVQEKASRAGIPFHAATPEGRNYVEILNFASREKVDLIVLGARGLGTVDGDDLGSVAEKVLFHADCDVLIARTPFPRSGQGVFCGVDGSEASYQAARRAAGWAHALGAPLTLAAVFDPVFHRGVFRTISDVLPEEVGERFDFKSQERLHDEIIDKGLERLYQTYLDEAAEVVADGRADGLEKRLLTGKPYHAVLEELAPGRASLLVVGRYGRHREEVSRIGSNALSLARRSPVSVLVTSGSYRPPERAKEGAQPAAESQVTWDPEAEERLKRVPIFVRRMAKKAIENFAGEKGLDRVTLDVYLEPKKRFGM